MKYPIGIQTFEKLRENGCVYVDKTEYIYRLVKTGNCCFLSRPRRFGKSLLVSTLKAYFSGRRDLFEGLAIEKLEKDWLEYPVLTFSFNENECTSVEILEAMLHRQLSAYEREYGRDGSETTLADRFVGIIRRASESRGLKTVILIDEYDKPLLDTIDNEEEHDKNRNLLKGFYGNLKAQDEYIQFVFLTGVTKFSHVSVFSGLNNLRDISMDLRYDAICGITEKELHTYFEEAINDLAESTEKTYDETCDELEKQYDGYHFHYKGVGVYNPFSLLNAFESGEIGSYWFETGTPTFLVKLLQTNKYNIGNLENVSQSAAALGDISSMKTNPVPALYQSGYLTIKGYDKEFRTYRLGYPNKEVEVGFLNFLLPYYFSFNGGTQPAEFIEKFVSCLRRGEAEEFMSLLKDFFDGGNYQIAWDREIYFQVALYMAFKLLGFYTNAEYATAKGRADIVVQTTDYVYVFELKLDGGAEEALRQIEEKGYAKPFVSGSRKVFRIGANFSSATRSIDDWRIA